jgi:hypothetical protein
MSFDPPIASHDVVLFLDSSADATHKTPLLLLLDVIYLSIDTAEGTTG